MEKLLPKLGIYRLKDLIKAIRACKTAADERAVIAKESAFLRTSFKEENVDIRHVNVAKLLYIHMLGYPAQFGQIECLKLVASPRFADKRLGYLGIMLLLDENQEVLTLVTNSLKNDLNSSTTVVVGLALCTLGNISSQEMARDLAPEVEKLLSSSNSYVRKKAALCALRIIKKVPDLLENFVSRAKQLLNERNHGVLLTGITLLIEMCKASPEVTKDLRTHSVSVLVRHLKNLVTAGFSPEHDVNGITDPFVQVKILRLMRILGKGDVEASEAMNDILAQVATNTEASKNVGNAILYEAVLTIMDIESESSLRVLAINILGRFLANRDNNIRYVALTTLTRTAQANTTDSSALQRHRSTVIECLRDPDISIRRRALDLSFFLINSANIRILTRELLSFLEVCENDIKNSVAARICDFAGRYRPNKRWELDTVCRVLRVAGAWVDQSVVSHFVKLVMTSEPDLQQYAVRKLYNTVKNEGDKATTQEGLVQATLWLVGEYGDVLVGGTAGLLGADEEEQVQSGTQEKRDYQAAPAEQDVVNAIETLLKGPHATEAVKEWAVMALVKITTRFTGSDVIGHVKELIAQYHKTPQLELQQRSVEYSHLLTLALDMRQSVLERVPVLESAEREEKRKGLGVPAVESSNTTSNAAATAGKTEVDLLGDDLLGINFGGGTGAGVVDAVFGGVGSQPQTAPQNLLDLLGDIGFGSAAATPASAATKPPLAAAASSASMGGTGDLLGDLFGSALSAPAASAAPQRTSHIAYNKNNTQLTLHVTREANGAAASMTAELKNNTQGTVDNVGIMVAVPKSLKVIMMPQVERGCAAGSSVKQDFKVENPTKVPIKLRLKIVYTVQGNPPVEDVVEFAGFDRSLWA